MRAAFLTGHGRKDCLVLGTMPDPSPGPGEVLVRLHAAAMNRVDLYMRDDARGITHDLPLIAGVDGAGVVEALGLGATGLDVGARVLVFPPIHCGACEFCKAGEITMCRRLRVTGEHRDGTYADLIVLPARNALRLPSTIGFAEAAALGAGHMTAWRAVHTQGRVRAGETVLVTGIGGGVAVAALQIAAHAGARVIVTSSQDWKLERAAALGADGTVNYVREDVAESVLALTGGRGVDLVIDGAGKAAWDAGLRLLVRGGRFVSYGATTGDDPPADLKRLFIKQIEIRGSVLANYAETDRLLRLCAERRIAPVIDARFPLGSIHAAYDHLEAGRQFGRIVIEIASHERTA